MRGNKGIDEVDAEILRLIYKNPSISQVELAESVGLTQPAISLRLKRLKEMNIIDGPAYSIDPSKIGVEVVGVEITTNKPSRLMDKFKECSCMINIFASDNSVFMLMNGESKEFINCCLLRHVYGDNDVIRVVPKEVNGMLRTVRNHTKGYLYDTTPCDDGKCSECPYYVDNGGKCNGCPMTKFYKGFLWGSSSD